MTYRVPLTNHIGTITHVGLTIHSRTITPEGLTNHGRSMTVEARRSYHHNEAAKTQVSVLSRVRCEYLSLRVFK